MKKEIKIVLSIALGVAIVAALITSFSERSPVYGNLETQQEEFFEIQVPAGWQREEADGIISYYDRNSLDTSNNAINVGALPNVFESYSDLGDEQKDQLVEILQTTFNDSIAESEDTAGISFNALDAQPTTHPIADRATRIILSDQDEDGVEFVGEARLIITAEGDAYFIQIASPKTIFEAEVDTIRSIIENFVEVENDQAQDTQAEEE